MAILNTLLANTGNTLSIANAATTLTTSSIALVKSMSDNTPPGINGFVFSIPETETLTMASQITDHWTQDNLAVQDHIALEPIKITLTGKVSEVVWTKTQAERFADQVINNFASVEVMSPEFAQATTQFLASVNELKRQVDQSLKVYRDLKNIFSNEEKKLTKQQQAFSDLQKTWSQRTLCTVDTPWAQFKSMVIENIEFEQDETSNDVSTVSVTFKQLNSIAVIATQPPKPGRAEAQQTENVKKGQVTGQLVVDPNAQQNFLNSALSNGQLS